MHKNKNPSPINRSEAENIFSRGSTDEICDALLAITFYEEDWKWSQMQCLHFLGHSDSNVSGLAATCLGHIARIHHKLDKELVITALLDRLKDSKISGQIQDALDDIEMFCNNNK